MCDCRAQTELRGIMDANRRRSGKAADFYSENIQFGSKPQHPMFCRTSQFSQVRLRNFVSITSGIKQLTFFFPNSSFTSHSAVEVM